MNASQCSREGHHVPQITATIISPVRWRRLVPDSDRDDNRLTVPSRIPRTHLVSKTWQRACTNLQRSSESDLVPIGDFKLT